MMKRGQIQGNMNQIMREEKFISQLNRTLYFVESD